MHALPSGASIHRHPGGWGDLGNHARFANVYCDLGLIPASQAEQSLDAANGTSNDDISRSQAARSGQRSRSSSRPMKLYFNTAELTDGIRRSLVHVKSAVLRLHWTGNTPSHRSKYSYAYD